MAPDPPDRPRLTTRVTGPKGEREGGREGKGGREGGREREGERGSEDREGEQEG